MKRVILYAGILVSLLQTDVFATQGLWQPMDLQQRNAANDLHPGQYYRSDDAQLRQILSRATQDNRSNTNTNTIIELPVISGEIQQFRVQESPILEPALAAKFPEIKTYEIHGIDDPHSSGRLSYTPKGFNAMIVSQSGTFYLDPFKDRSYRGYSKESSTSAAPFNCGVEGHTHSAPVSIYARRNASRIPGSLRVYRLALAAASEYVTAVGGTKTAAMSEMVNTMNRVNFIYQRDLAIRLDLVANNDSIIFDVAPSSDPYTNPDVNTMLDENQATLDIVIGTANYDIGHVFGTGGGGIASVGSVCENGFKAQGATGLAGTPDDTFYIDYVAHEMGHQFGADHSFNGTTLSCRSNRSASTAVEPGSGSTVMGYANICGLEDLQNSSDAHFHATSINQIDTYTAAGGNCSINISASNSNEPTANAGNDFTIPHETPFVLTASANDLDGDALTYNWYQMDAGSATTATTFGQDLVNNALYRSYLPRSENTRHFPALDTTLNNQYDDAEVLACNDRDINFRLTVRDGESGIAHDDLVVSVDKDSGPFKVESFNAVQTLSPGNYQINWDVAGTNQAPVNCSNVDISLLVFNTTETSYSETALANNEANDGSALVFVPDVAASKARFKIQCANHIFYDISDNFVNINGANTVSTSGNTVFRNENGLTLSFTPPTCVVVDSGSSDSGSGGININWLLSMFLLLLFRQRLSK